MPLLLRLSRCPNTHHLLTRHTQQLRYFHPSRRKLNDAFPDHYATLDLPSSASPAEIKKQFYALSKKYHPDVNHAPSASERFVNISEAYHILGSAEKKGKYDRDLQRAHGGGGVGARTGSFSSRSAGGPAGGRPASGLSKRRSQFRGPPPSFYAQGGYGSQGGKRQRAQANADEQAQARAQQSGPHDPNHPSGLGSQPNYTGSGGFSPGSGDAEFDPDPSMPYFDKAGHRRTHEGLGARRESAEARRPRVDPYAHTHGGGGLIANFFIVSAVVATATVAATLILEFVRQGPGASHGGARRRESRPDG